MTTTHFRTPPKVLLSANSAAKAAAKAAAKSAVQTVDIVRWNATDPITTDSTTTSDTVVTEAPLEIVLQAGDVAEVLSVTMRTPGDDRALVMGLLLAEGIIDGPDALTDVHTCRHHPNRARAFLRAPSLPDLLTQRRHLPVSASCGLCGKTSADAALQLRDRPPLPPTHHTPCPRDLNWIATLPAQARQRQPIFDQTGALHAAALFNADTRGLVDVREDVGRHNAVDKLLGAQALSGRWPLARDILLLSGRVSFELIQKAYAAYIPVVVAVGAPSSLAISTAALAGMTLIGFTRADRMNVYTGGLTPNPSP